MLLEHSSMLLLPSPAAASLRQLSGQVGQMIQRWAISSADGTVLTLTDAALDCECMLATTMDIWQID
jgi:hypothetical protein